MPNDRTVDFVVMFLVFGMIGLGLLSVLVGKITTWWDRVVNTSQAVMSHDAESRSADQADRQADRPSVSADDLHVERLQFDRSKAALIEVMVYNGWQVGEIRAVLKGDNGAIGAEVEQARVRLGLSTPERQLRVRDEKGERLIPLER